MNKATIALIFILLNVVRNEPKRSATFGLKKTYGFLHILAYTNYEVELSDDGKVDPKLTASNSDWYFWGGFQDKFSSGAYTLAYKVAVNGVEGAEVKKAWKETTTKDVLPVGEFVLPEVCKTSKTYKAEVINNGWKGTEKQIKLVFTCPAAEKTEPEKNLQLEIQKGLEKKIHEIIKNEDTNKSTIENEGKPEGLKAKADNIQKLEENIPVIIEEENLNQKIEVLVDKNVVIKENEVIPEKKIDEEERRILL